MEAAWPFQTIGLLTAGARKVHMLSTWRNRSHFFFSGVGCVCVVVLLGCLLSACGQVNNLSRNTSVANAAPTAAPSPTSAVPKLLRPDLERGIVYPQWGPDSYGVTDTTWQQGIKAIKTQTGATWLEIPVLLQQATGSSTSVGPGATAPGLDAFASGIRAARALGYHVFFIPLLGVETPGGWAGIVQVSAPYQEDWFNSYWGALKPYAEVAQENGVEQMAIGTEILWMEANAPATLWNQLITRAQSVFKGTLTYDVNWYPSLYNAPADWLKNPALTYIGVSEYIPLSDTPQRVDPDAMPALWQDRVGKRIDTFSAQVGKPVLITEIGYRDTSDALYNPYAPQSSASTDPQEQAAAYAAALISIFADSHIVGVFCWGWDNVGALGIAGQQAVQVIDRWYTKEA